MNLVKRVCQTGALTLMALVLMVISSASAIKHVKGQTIYIPSYSNIISGIQRIVLKANLIIHNSDPAHSITIVKIDHYDTSGTLVEKYLQQPIKLNPLAATRIVIKEPEQGDEGAGANFIVQWQSENNVIEPLLECVMIGTSGTQGYSFTSFGRIIEEHND
jgi:hypothetical protein